MKKIDRVIYRGISKKGNGFILRYPRFGDLQSMLHYINAISKERTFSNFQGEQITLEEEKRYLEMLLKEMKLDRNVTLLVYNGDKLIGGSGIALGNRIENHIGIFGISLAKNFRGEGIGTVLMQEVINESVKQIPSLRIVILKVFANNTVAFKMYQKFGFKEYGRLPQGIQYRGKFVDAILMYKTINR